MNKHRSQRGAAPPPASKATASPKSPHGGGAHHAPKEGNSERENYNGGCPCFLLHDFTLFRYGTSPSRFKLVWLNACRTFEGPNDDYDTSLGKKFGGPPDAEHSPEEVPKPELHTWKVAFHTECFMGFVNTMYILHGRDLDNYFWHTAQADRDLDTVQVLEEAKRNIDRIWKNLFEQSTNPVCNGEVGDARAAGRTYLYPQ